MSSKKFRWLVGVSLWAIVLSSGAAFGQNQKPNPNQNPQGPAGAWQGRWPRGQGANSPWGPGVTPEQVRGAGTIQEIAPNGVMHIVGGATEHWYVLLQPQARVSFSASAEPSWLQPGMFVRFSAKIDKRGKLENPLTSLQVITPSNQQQPGIKPEGTSNKGGSDPITAELFVDSKTASDKPKKKVEAAPPPPTSFAVIGRVVSYRSGKMTISAGGTTLNAELDEKAKVFVEYSDLSLLQPGDKVEFDGQAHPMQKTQVWARSADIAAAKTFTAESRMTKKKSPATKTEDADPAAKPAAADANKTAGNE